MDIERYNLRIRQAVNSADIKSWASLDDKKSYCRELLGQIDEHEVVANILADTLYDLIQCRAEDKFASYHVGDGVSILGNGQCLPATIIDVAPDQITVQKDKISDTGEFIADGTALEITFTRSHDQVFIYTEGRRLSRLVVGKHFADYSASQITDRLKHLTQ